MPEPLPIPISLFDIELNLCRSALITGITGQDGSYLAELLLEKGYQVHDKRRASSFNTSRIDHLYQTRMKATTLISPLRRPHRQHQFDRIIQQVLSDEIYNLVAQSHVAVSFESPNTPPTAMHWARCGSWRQSDSRTNEENEDLPGEHSELYGLVQEIPQKESTPFTRSPHGVAKLYAYRSR